MGPAHVVTLADDDELRFWESVFLVELAKPDVPHLDRTWAAAQRADKAVLERRDRWAAD